LLVQAFHFDRCQPCSDPKKPASSSHLWNGKGKGSTSSSRSFFVMKKHKGILSSRRIILIYLCIYVSMYLSNKKLWLGTAQIWKTECKTYIDLKIRLP
jgi:hypothetical protein